MLEAGRHEIAGSPEFGKAHAYALIDLVRTVAFDNEKFVKFVNSRR
jgi:hypothetical protein